MSFIKRSRYVSLTKVKYALFEEMKANDWFIELRYFTIVALTPAVALSVIVWPFNDIELLHYFILSFSISSHIWAINVALTSNEWRKQNIKDILACLGPLDKAQGTGNDSDRLLYTKFKNGIIFKYKLNLREFVIISMIQRVHMLFIGFIVSLFYIYHFVTYPPPVTAPASTQMAYVYIPAFFSFCLWIFYFWSFAYDMRANYNNSFPISMKTKIMTIVFVAGSSLFMFTALVLLALFITARIPIFNFY